jgi:crotonobetainyl-CoA:carnitine CoA-transferase CaiB-like acyl-CoA transferase
MPLKGVRILDMSSVVVGPYATQFLADFGAEVTKIEAPSGDILRRLGGKSKSGELSPKFIALNRNKKSLAIDLKKPGAKAVIKTLLESHDVVLSNIRPKALARLGLDYESARALRPDVIYCSIVGFGQEGPYRDKPAYDNVIQGVGGIAACHQRQGGTPLYLPMVLADRLGGLMSVQSILLALLHREKTGEGQHIEVPMYENTAVFVLTEHLGQMIYPGSGGPSGDVRVLNKDARPIKTKDGHICISANSDAQAFAFFEAIGRPELKEDERFNSVGGRYANVDLYNGLRVEALAQKTTAEWIAIFERLDVPAMPFKSFEDLMEDPHLNEVGLFEQTDHPLEGKVVNLRPVATFSSIAMKRDNLAPRLGEHSGALLREFGMPADAVAQLAEDGVIVDRPLDGEGN